MYARVALLSLLSSVLFAACAAPAPLTPTVVSSPPTVLVPFTPNAPDAALATLLPTVVVPPTTPIPTLAPIIVTATPTATTTSGSGTSVTGTATTRPPAPRTAPAQPTPAETATPFPADVPAVYVTALTVDPATPKADVAGTFHVTFQNPGALDQGYAWCVEIWDASETKKPFGLTTCQHSTMTPGVSAFTSTGWQVKGLGECRAYRGRVVERDENDNRHSFIQPDGNILWLDFNVCP